MALRFCVCFQVGDYGTNSFMGIPLLVGGSILWKFPFSHPAGHNWHFLSPVKVVWSKWQSLVTGMVLELGLLQSHAPPRKTLSCVNIFWRKLMDMGFLPILSITALSFHLFGHFAWKGHLFLAGNSKHVLFQQMARNNSSLLSNPKVTAGRTNLCIHLESGGWTQETSVWFLLPSNSQCLILDHDHICVLIRARCYHRGVRLKPKPHFC